MTTKLGVYARIRPDATGAICNDMQVSGSGKGVHIRNLEFALDGVFGGTSTQKHVYDRIAKDRVSLALKGFNVCILVCALLSTVCRNTLAPPHVTQPRYTGVRSDRIGQDPHNVRT